MTTTKTTDTGTTGDGDERCAVNYGGGVDGYEYQLRRDIGGGEREGTSTTGDGERQKSSPPPPVKSTCDRWGLKLSEEARRAIAAVRFIAAHLKNEDDYAEVRFVSVCCPSVFVDLLV